MNENDLKESVRNGIVGGLTFVGTAIVLTNPVLLAGVAATVLTAWAMSGDGDGEGPGDEAANGGQSGGEDG